MSANIDFQFDVVQVFRNLISQNGNIREVQIHFREKYVGISALAELKSIDKLDAGLQQYYGLHHDVGFMWLPTSVAN